MLRTPIIAGLTVALLGGTALAQPNGASGPPSTLSDSARGAPDYDDDDDARNPAPPRGYADGPPPPRGYDQGPPPNGSAYSDRQPTAAAQANADAGRDRDMFCRRDAAARTGYTTPGEAAHDEQVRGSVGGTLGGAALGAIIGAGAGNAGLGAAAGAGAGLIAGTAVGADNARHAARDVQADYSSAYYACMHQADTGGRSAYGYGDAGYGGDYGPPPPPPPGSYYGYPAPYYPYYYGPGYYGPSVSFGFGFGGGRHWGGGYRGYHGGRHH
jgi:hypothetical protein